MKRPEAVAITKPPPPQTEPVLIRYVVPPEWTLLKRPQESPRSRVIGRDWRARLTHAKP
jgi:hypothetical protein